MDSAGTAAWRVGVAAGAHRKANEALAKGLPAKIAIKAATTALQVLDTPMQDMPRLGHTTDLQVVTLDTWQVPTVTGVLAAVDTQHNAHIRNYSNTFIGVLLPMQLGRGHVWRMRLLEMQLRAFIADGSQWRAALAAAKHLLPFYRSVYPKVGRVNWQDSSERLVLLCAVSTERSAVPSSANSPKHCSIIPRNLEDCS